MSCPRFAHFVVALALVASLPTAPTSAGAPAGQPCGGFRIADGQVELTRSIRFADVRSAATDACLAAIARELTARPEVRSVLVSARVDGGEMLRREGAAAAALAAERLIAHGVPRAQISTVVPRTRPNELDSIQISFVERRPFRPVAQVFATSGTVQTGHSPTQLVTATPGSVLASHQHIETGAGSVATVHLVDGSRLRITPESAVRFGDIAIADRGRRDVTLELIRGQAHLRSSGREGPLRFTTPNATVAVQGTSFRLVITEDRHTRVEALAGTVSFSGPRGQVFVARGEGAAVDPSGYPTEPRRLLLAPRVIEPVLGPRAEGELLIWSSVPQATSYHVEFARNAQFDQSYWDIVVPRERMLVGALHAPGKWFWRVTGIDPAGYFGFSSKIYAFEVP